MSKILLLFSLALSCQTIHAQLTTDHLFTKEQLVDIITGSDIIVTDVIYFGTDSARGYFDASTINIGLTEGVVMTSGTVLDSVTNNFGYSEYGPAGQASDDMSLVNSQPGYQLLTDLAGFNSYNAAAFEIDFLPNGDTVELKFIFASEEYPEYVCSDLNDAFGVFLTGPNPFGADYVDFNIPLIPGTNIPVSINSINSGLPGSNGDSAYCSIQELSNSAYYVDNTGGLELRFDGYSLPITIKMAVQCGAAYKIKLAVSDIGDEIYDSGVFIESNSFKATSSSLPCGANITTQEQFQMVFPNPLKNQARIVSSEALLNENYQLSDLNGKIITQGIIDKLEFEINLEDLAPGVYVLRTGQSQIKLVKQ